MSKIQGVIDLIKSDTKINLTISSSKNNIYITENETDKVSTIPKKTLIDIFNNPAIKMILKALS